MPTSVHTMVVHPPSTSQRQLSEAELEKAGITPGLLRVSVGLEDLEDLQADFGAALAAAHGATAAAREPLVPAVGAI
jgi:O-acetylhomoserine/O-acetylserine sulfhydrylase-like pyridoxal-dependent enzyme